MTKRPAAHAERTRKIAERPAIPDFIDRPNEPQEAFADKPKRKRPRHVRHARKQKPRTRD